MSEQGVRALLARLESDQGFRERLEAAPGNDARRQIVLDAGFDVQASDLPTLRSLTGIQELSDEDLEKVAGGIGTATGGSLVMSGGVVAAVAVAALF